MAEADWTVFDDAPDVNTIRRGSTQGITPPSGGDFVFAFNSAIQIEGASGLYHNGGDFAPMAEGCSIRAAIQKGAGGGVAGSTPLLIALAGQSVNDPAYMLCFANNDPAKLLLVKGAPANGPDGAVTLRESDESFAIGEWVHLKLDIVVNDNGDVSLTVFRNDLSANPIGGAFVWETVGGMAPYVDDALGINSGSLPIVGGRGGFGMWCNEVTRRAYIANVELTRQVP
jgi:hypothetical protein